MTFKLRDRVRQTSTTAGLGNLTLNGAVGSFRSVASVYAVGDTFYGMIVNRDVPAEWEACSLTREADSGGNTVVSRSAVTASSNADAAVNFSAGTKDVTVAYPGTKAIIEEPSGLITKSAKRVISGVELALAANSDVAGIPNAEGGKLYLASAALVDPALSGGRAQFQSVIIFHVAGVASAVGGIELVIPESGTITITVVILATNAWRIRWNKSGGGNYDLYYSIIQLN